MRAPVEEHISAAQVALLERGVEILAARPPLGEPEMRSHCRAMDDVVALELSPDGRGRREVCGRQLAIGLARHREDGSGPFYGFGSPSPPSTRPGEARRCIHAGA